MSAPNGGAGSAISERLKSVALRTAWKVQDLVARASRKKPDFLIIGAQKAGTTSLHAYLGAHPDLAPALGPKELHFFNIYYHRGLRWYLAHFPLRTRAGGKLWFEATPDYLGHADAPTRVRKSIGRPKLIAVLRDPAERAYSAWNMWHSFATRADRDPRRADRRSFSEAIEAELASPTGQAHLHFHYLAMGRYAEHLERWCGHFRRQDMLLLDHADMDNDLARFLSEICHFLRVDPWDEATMRGFAGERHWAGPSRRRTDADEATIALLGSYYEPFDARLASFLGRAPSWRV